ncbi:hypothetical protein niasHT_016449 [Heterodera trifolii]|uniref:Uncharacterized protein n=1 Tax=Heterodera trifolii TaxID=157864 RepID=A0ABD2LJ14_9BILA
MRMFLVPEDLFNSVINSSTTPADGTALGLVRQCLHQIERNRNMDENERVANYHQEFKRLNKIVREQEQRPMDVRLQNRNEIMSAIPPPPSPNLSGPLQTFHPPQNTGTKTKSVASTKPFRIVNKRKSIKEKLLRNKSKKAKKSYFNTKNGDENEDDDDGEDDEWGRNSAEKEDQTMRQQQQPSSSAFPYKLRSGSAAEGEEPQKGTKKSKKRTEPKNSSQY